ncbi:alcohol dehydrogenase-like isoform X1 [Saccostrea echinata]|uniref:alcohol dehydrogenase-like isoform X1 n=1 Tax=Saccostrea echinata TaxID=191078 RepID=UPI002A81F2E1|nr:alcohol dehydrogenase-like isoform X1 [Saccostrea echinata]
MDRAPNPPWCRQVIMLDNEMLVDRHPSHDLCNPFEVSSSLAMPSMPKGGVLVRVQCLGACSPEGQIKRKDLHPILPGIEVAGVVQDVCPSIPNRNFSTGDRVILYLDEDFAETGYQEYIAIDDTEKCIQIPDSIPLEVAAMLPGSALSAYSAVMKAKPHIEKLQEVKSGINVLIVGAGGLGLWAVQLANYMLSQFSQTNIKLFVSDNSIDKLLTALDHGCYDVIHWNEEDHEQFIIERTLEACKGGVDVVIDFVSSPRTVHRTLKVLNREGLILVGGNTMSEVSINLNVLAAKQQSIVGIPKGSLKELLELVDLVADQKVKPPLFSIHNVEDANQVFEDLYQSRITGRAILKINHSQTVDN